MKIIEKQSFRSGSYVNTTDDMVRIILDMTMSEWYLFCDVFAQTKDDDEGELTYQGE